MLRGDDSPFPVIPRTPVPKVSRYRKEVYVPYIKKWKAIMDQIYLIEEDYDLFRFAYMQNSSQNSIAKSMNE
jgi:hypothetical protein